MNHVHNTRIYESWTKTCIILTILIRMMNSKMHVCQLFHNFLTKMLGYRFRSVLYLLAVDTSRTLDKESCFCKIHASLASIKGYFDPFNLKQHQTHHIWIFNWRQWDLVITTRSLSIYSKCNINMNNSLYDHSCRWNPWICYCGFWLFRYKFVSIQFYSISCN